MSILQKIAILQCYIGHMKNVEVKIKVPRNMHELTLLEKAYSVAINHIIIL